PMQFEMAPIFEEVNLANDHNALAMDIARKVALRHDFVCVFYEKPFAGLNGSGKHCNWSMATDKGENLLEPGRTPHQNLRFLAFLAVCLKAVHDHSVALRYTIANAANDLRLGANEAPPAILSCFVGDQLTRVIERVISGTGGEDAEHFVLQMGVAKLPQLARDNTDRNRTSPFAFTGNKFEYRAVGSSANCAVPMALLNAAVADALGQMTKRLKARIDGGSARDEAVLGLLKEVFTETSPIRFEGNNYSDEWRHEAEKRGLPNLVDTPSAIAAFADKKHSGFLTELGIFSKEEIASRENVALERYIKQVTLEAETVIEMLETLVAPAAEKQLALTAAALKARMELKAAGVSFIAGKASESLTKRTSALGDGLTEILAAADQLKDRLKEIDGIHDEAKKARRLADDVRTLMADARVAADRLETLVEDGAWVLPKYREMLFVR
ncbi:MAG TPA: glutamine synthetase type III, partial [Candidatus Eisenbacteria bacterium]